MIAYYKICSIFIFVCNLESGDSILHMQRQIESVKNLKSELTNANSLIIANMNDATIFSSSDLKLNIETLTRISKSHNLNFEIINLSLLHFHADGSTFKSNHIRIASFFNSILAD